MSRVAGALMVAVGLVAAGPGATPVAATPVAATPRRGGAGRRRGLARLDQGQRAPESAGQHGHPATFDRATLPVAVTADDGPDTVPVGSFTSATDAVFGGSFGLNLGQAGPRLGSP